MKKLLFLLLPLCLCRGAELYVDVNAPSGGNGSEKQPFNTIQAAADRVNPGDTVIIKPGVYFGAVHIKRFGTKDAPVTFRADKVKKNRVIVTGADKAIRTKAVKWQLHDAKTQTYCTKTIHPNPPRVLYSEVDLFPYQSLKLLMTFEARPGVPGPRHGFFYDRKTKKLYVRLRPDGKYGSTDPNKHIMAVAPTKGGHTDGELPNSVYYNFGLKGTPGKSLNVIIDGITFETPSRTAVYVCGNDVTVRNCLFLGCMAGGVSGRFIGEDSKSAERFSQSSNNILVEQCEWHNFPLYEDTAELIELVSSGKIPIKNPADRRHFWWVHKHPSRGTKVYYETGIIRNIGKNWTMRKCYVHNVFDGIANMNKAENTVIEECLFSRCSDNAISAENHPVNCHIRRNKFVDVFQSVSYQPLGGLPWPGPVYVYQNIFYYTSKNAFKDGYLSAFKIGVPAGQAKRPNVVNRKDMAGYNWNDITIPGMHIFNNTVISPKFRLVGDLGAPVQIIRNVNFYNNLAVVSTLSSSMRKKGEGGVKSYTYVNNKFALIRKDNPVFPAVKGQTTRNAKAVLPDWKQNSFVPAEFTPSVPVKGMPESFKYVGALQSADDDFAKDAGIKEEI